MKRVANKTVRVAAFAMVVVLALASCAGLITSQARGEFDTGRALFSQGMFEQAIPYFERAISMDPDFYEANLYLGRSYLNLRNYGKALGPLRTAYRLSPEDFKKQSVDILVDALLGAALSEANQGNIGASLGYVREVLSTDLKAERVREDISRVLVAVAMELFKSGKVREAIEEYTEAIKANPDNSDAYVGLAKALIKNGDFLKALDAASRALSVNPENTDALDIMKNSVGR
ncbi:MAG TPA: tetratricopeptide repeat protein [Syntrophorhabdaceae bacterium]|nr:tetratricopeptide repeat protein [Syntrophorhabdaceae bacterium]